ncbi:MAG: hypothetical protein M1830_010298 [Pleopsidium flavum]|nr:MAG: hypothetical protein M1830_010298 [Pleopsidium flavum]
MEIVLRYLLFLLCWATSTIAAPTDNNSNNVAITGSSDAWASLVANVVPLLILVGEKHVKAYFKCLIQPSQAYLYAVSPIGLVTAMVTTIRMGESHFMKRLIGRQFESRTEVLAEVTSVSGGNIGFELRGPRNMLEQILNPNPRDVAQFWVQGHMVGTGRDGIKFFANVEAVIDSASKPEFGPLGKASPMEAPLEHLTHLRRFLSRILIWRAEPRGSSDHNDGVVLDAQSSEDYHNSISKYNVDDVGGAENEMSDASRRCRKTALVVFEAHGESARDMSRYYAGQSAKSRPPEEWPSEIFQDSWCSSRGLAYLSWPDVSHPLTTSMNVRVAALTRARLTASFICLSANAALIILNWRVKHDVTTTTFISLGFLGSYAFGIWTALSVTRTTSQEMISLEGIQPFRAGFSSSNYPWGVQSAYCPKKVVMSMERNEKSRRQLGVDPVWHTPFFVFLTAVSFLILYLGLRAAEWWVPFAMFGVVSFASCMRAMLNVNSPLFGSDWYKSSGSRWTPDPLAGSDPLWFLHLWCDLQRKAETASLPTQPKRGTQKRKRSGTVVSISEKARLCTRASAVIRSLFFRPDRTIPALKNDSNFDMEVEHSGLDYPSQKKTTAFTDTSWKRWTTLAASCKGIPSKIDPKFQNVRETRGRYQSQLLHVGFAVATEMARRDLLPSEVTFQKHPPHDPARGRRKHSGTEFVRSEFISRDGLWQQSLEVAITHSEDDYLNPEAVVTTHLRAWAVQALLGGHRLSKSQSFDYRPGTDGIVEIRNALVLHLTEEMEAINNLSMEDFWKQEERNQSESSRRGTESIHLNGVSSVHSTDQSTGGKCREHSESHSATGLDPAIALSLVRGFWSSPWMLWMATKIILSLFPEEYSLVRCLPNQTNDDNTTDGSHISYNCTRLGRNWERAYVDFLVAGGLTRLKPAALSAAEASQGTSASIQNDTGSIDCSVKGKTEWRSGCSPGPKEFGEANSGRAAASQNIGYMSFG